jgi:hypothetical protein
MPRYVTTGLIIALGIIAARVVGKFFGIGVSTTSTTTTTS